MDNKAEVFKSGRFLIIMLLLSLLHCIEVFAVTSSANLGLQHLNEVMDASHKTFHVYTDLSAAGNHFVVFGKSSSPGDENKVFMDPGYAINPHSGTSCIRNQFVAEGENWGGWYFQNGVLNGEDTQPKPNWGDYQNAGMNLTGAIKLTFWARGENGGERVEFFAFGVGRDAFGVPFKTYPDSSPKVSLGFKTLSKKWKKYTIDLRGKDLSYVIGGFGWVTNAPINNNTGITFYLDDIQYHSDRLDEPRFLVSYETIHSSADFDTTMKNAAFIYDNALALIAFLSTGKTDGIRRAGLIADSFVYAVNNDRYFTDGRLRNAYQGGDLVLPHGWRPHNKEGTVRMPGWWDSSDTLWYEDRFQVSTSTGNMAWGIIALLSYYEKVGGPQYLNAAITAAEWIEQEARDQRGEGGYTGGYDGWEMTGTNPQGQTKLLWKSTEHNIDVYVAFARLFKITGDSVWKERALHAKTFVEAMWDHDSGHFWAGTLEDGVTLNKSVQPCDINSWGVMALGDINKYGRAIHWNEEHCSVETSGYKGFDFNDDQDCVWFEGTAHMALAYQIAGEKEKVNLYRSELRRAQKKTPQNNRKGIVASCCDGLTTGLDWLYYDRLHIGATSWFIFLERGLNPFWGIKTADQIPSYEPDTLTIRYSYKEFTLVDVCTFEENWCGYADQQNKAVIFGEMFSDIQLEAPFKKLDVTVSIPCYGWGEGLAGPSGSSAQIMVNSAVKEENINSTLPYHHDAYYKYESCESFTNTFDIGDEKQIRFRIKMNNGARLDFEVAQLTFY